MNVVTEQIADRHRHDVLGSARPAFTGSREISVSSLMPVISREHAVAPLAPMAEIQAMRAGDNHMVTAIATRCAATTVRTDAGARWLHTPKFGPYYHFQRWRSAT